MFRIYITDALKTLTENTARFAGGSMLKSRYYEIITQKNTAQEEKSGGEIVADIVTRAGLELV